ncbi:hypothetical protein KX816_01850 [Sphingosinicellaceae bacterium]|nr:hypothetical protein KX816_01850 [Sphingosinicellaceae bacterium]
MISLHDRACFDAAAFLCRQSSLQRLLLSRIANLQRDVGDLTELTHILVVQPGDTEADIIDEIGLSPVINFIDGHRYGEAGFQPSWDWLHDVGGWFELIYTVGDTGFAYVLLIQDDEGVDPELLGMCREYAR